MVGEIVQKHLPQMTACRRKKLCQKWHSFLPLFLEGAVRSAP